MPRLTLDALDLASLAATRAPWSSFAPTWKLDFEGTLDDATLARALDFTVKKYPSAAATITDGHWNVPDVPALTFSAADDEQAVVDEFLEVSRTVLDVRLLRRPSGGTLLFHQHHGLADGRAFLELLGDFFRALDAAERSAPSPFSTELVLRRRQVETVSARGVARVVTFFKGALASLFELLSTRLSPLSRLPSNVGQDYSGHHRTLHHALSLQRLEQLRERRTQRGLSANDVLAGAVVTALSRWSGVEGTHTLLMPVDVRPRTGFVSLANHLSNLQVRFAASPSRTALEHTVALAKALAPQRQKRTPFDRVLFDTFLLRLLPLSALRRALLDERALLTCFSFSNLLPLGVPCGNEHGTWSTGRLNVTGLRITTPCVPPQGVNLTVVQSGPNAIFNFNFKDSAVTEAQVAALKDHFHAAFEELERTL